MEAKRTPGGLEKYQRMAEKDEKRYAEELRDFRERVEKTFDAEHGLLPIVNKISTNVQRLALIYFICAPRPSHIFIHGKPFCPPYSSQNS